MTNEQRRLAAIVSADVAGYSRLMGRDEYGTLASIRPWRGGEATGRARGPRSDSC